MNDELSEKDQLLTLFLLGWGRGGERNVGSENRSRWIFWNNFWRGWAIDLIRGDFS